MSPVRRRQVRPAPPWILPLVLGGLLAVSCIAWLLWGRQATPQLPQTAAASPVQLCDRTPGQILSLTVDNPYDEPYTLLQGQDGWQMEGEDGFVFRKAALEDMLQNCAGLTADDTLGDLKEHPEWQLMNFGLEEGCVRVTAEFTDDTSMTFRIGDGVPGEIPGRYLLLEGDSHIYITGTDVYEAYTYTCMGLHDVTDPALNGSLIDRIAFSGSDPFVMERRTDGWYMTEPLAYPLADDAVSRLLNRLEGLRFAQYVGSREKTDLSALGLDPARRTVTLDIAESILTGYDDKDQPTDQAVLPAYQLTFELGNTENDVVFYCLYRGEVMKATVFSAGFLLSQSWDSLLLTVPFNAPTNDLERLIVEQAGNREVYDIVLTERVLPNNSFETDESGNILYDFHVFRDGEETDAETFLTAYGRLLSLRTTDRLPDGYTLPDTPPRLSITVQRSSGGTRQVDLYPLDALYDAAAVDGTALFRMEKEKLTVDSLQ
ncbi:MAG: DUF4340 domain-containing protein [Clostridia bacterium]|nr:DUF4340 domain-containing protein [Clostridia bacterium]